MLNINCARQQSVIVVFLLLVSRYFNAIKNRGLLLTILQIIFIEQSLFIIIDN